MTDRDGADAADRGSGRARQGREGVRRLGCPMTDRDGADAADRGGGSAQQRREGVRRLVRTLVFVIVGKTRSKCPILAHSLLCPLCQIASTACLCCSMSLRYE